MNSYPESLFDAFNYCGETGLITHKKKTGVNEGVVSGCDNGKGYLRVTHKKKTYYAHRIAWFFTYGEVPDEQIDHINGNRSDNRISNLRKASNKENNHFKHVAQSRSKTGVLGVSFSAAANKWQSFFKKKYLGVFDTIEEAKAAYELEKTKTDPFRSKK